MNAAPNHIEKLQQVQDCCLRSALKLQAHISIKILHDAADIPLLKEDLLYFAKMHLTSFKNSSPIVQQLITDSTPSLMIPHHKSSLEALEVS
jgi:hypothetical protein